MARTKPSSAAATADLKCKPDPPIPIPIDPRAAARELYARAGLDVGAPVHPIALARAIDVRCCAADPDDLPPGALGMCDRERDGRFSILTQPGLSPACLASTVGHELGHVYAVDRLEPAQGAEVWQGLAAVSGLRMFDHLEATCDAIGYVLAVEIGGWPIDEPEWVRRRLARVVLPNGARLLAPRRRPRRLAARVASGAAS